MTEQGLAAAVAKMRASGANDPAIEVFAHYYRQAATGATGMIPEATIAPFTDPPQLSAVQVDDRTAREAIARTAIIKLNGGLGTSMGLDRAKTLVPVRDGLTFLDLIVRQIMAARRTYEAPLPLLFMNSFRTRDDTLAYLERYPDLAVGDLPIDFLQNAEPKITADTFEPVSWPADPSLEWCPPGHGDVYTALVGSGMLAALLGAGMKYASLSNGDNLGRPPTRGWPAGSPPAGRRTRPRCARAPSTIARAGISPSAAATANSSCGTRPRRRPRTWPTSPTSIGIRTSTPTTCGSTWSDWTPRCASGVPCWGCR